MDRKQARAFEGFVAESGDALLRIAMLLTSDPDVAEAVYQETLHRLALLLRQAKQQQAQAEAKRQRPDPGGSPGS